MKKYIIIYINTIILLLSVYNIVYFFPIVKIHNIFESTFIEIINVNDVEYAYLAIAIATAFYCLYQILKRLELK